MSYRLGIIGVGKITEGEHLPAALATDGVDVVALVDTSPERSRGCCDRFGISPHLTDTLEDIVNDVDGVIIATPNNSHARIAIRCLEAGVHVLIEKPLAITVQEGQDICQAASSAGRTVAVAYCTRFRENIIHMSSLLSSGYFGRLRRFAYQFGTRGGWTPVSNYILDRKASGGGVTVVSGSHFLDRMLHWFGYPNEITCEDDASGGPEANAVVTFVYGDGANACRGQVRFSKTTPLPAGFVMETDAGLAVIPDMGAGIRFRPAGLDTTEALLLPRQPYMDPRKGDYHRQLEDFVDACRTDRDPMVTGKQGVESLRLIEQIYACRRPLETTATAGGMG